MTLTPEEFKQNLVNFMDNFEGSPLPFSVAYFYLTPELLATAQPYGWDTDGGSYDITVYPHHVGMTPEQMTNCKSDECEGVPIIGHLNFDGKHPELSFRSWNFAKGILEKLREHVQYGQLTPEDHALAWAFCEAFDKKCHSDTDDNSRTMYFNGMQTPRGIKFVVHDDWMVCDIKVVYQDEVAEYIANVKSYLSN